MLSSRIAHHLTHCSAPRRLFQHNCRRWFTLLGLESSRESSCAAVVSSNGTIRSNVVMKRHLEHIDEERLYRFPLVQITAQQEHMPGVIRKALDEAGMDISGIDGIAFTQGPGIGGCLNVCSMSAKVLGATLDKPIFGVHHHQAHALAACIPSLYTTPPPSTADTSAEPPPAPPRFPFLAMIATSTHTILTTVSSPDDFRILALAEPGLGGAFDVTAELLTLRPVDESYGAALDVFCETGDARFFVEVEQNVVDEVKVPPITGYEMGKNGLMITGVSKMVSEFVKAEGGVRWVGKGTRLRLAREAREALARQMEAKLASAFAQCWRHELKVQDVVFCGGAASSMFLQRRLRAHLKKSFPRRSPNLICPPPRLCIDNAAMVAWAAMHRFERQDFDSYDVTPRPKWTLDRFSQKAVWKLQWHRVQETLKPLEETLKPPPDPTSG